MDNPMNNKTILVVDDERDIVELLEEEFCSLGANVLTAGNGDEALQIFQSKSFDAVLSDIRMPIMDGINFLKRAKQHSPEFKNFFLMTAYSETSKSEALELGARDVFFKPFVIEELVQVLEKELKSESA